MRNACVVQNPPQSYQSIVYTQSLYTHCAPAMGAWSTEHEWYCTLFQQKGSISSPSHCDERKSGLFLYFSILQYSFRLAFGMIFVKIFCTIVLEGDVVPLKSPFNLYNVMRSRCDFGFTFVRTLCIYVQ